MAEFLTNAEFRTELRAWPYDCENFLPIAQDGRYVAVPVDWFPEFVDWCRDNPLEPYAEESYDCDDMAGDRVADAGRSFREHVIPNSTAAFVFCELKIVPTSDYFGAKFDFNPNSHAACLVRADDKKIYLYEPQANAFADLAQLLDNHVVSSLDFVSL